MTLITFMLATFFGILLTACVVASGRKGNMDAKETKEILKISEPETSEPCGECMGAAFGDCAECPKGRIE